VNGGGPVTLRVERDGYLPVERQPAPDWATYVSLETIIMTALDPIVTPVDLATAQTPQVARGSVVSDTSGSRQATIVFTPGTAATAVLSDGTTTPLPRVSVRATEYTAGSNGPSAMPASLPATSAYTYAVEYSIDEASGASVQFNQPVVTYTDNFLHFQAGTIVPVGTYDAQRHAWIPAPNGIVIGVIAIDGGLAGVDVDGAGVPSSPA